jgi:hypothetical protein
MFLMLGKFMKKAGDYVNKHAERAREAEYEEEEEEEWEPSACDGNRRAVFVGINYTGQDGELAGCVNDAYNLRNFLVENYGFSEDNMMVLTDDHDDPELLPTRENIIHAMKWLVEDAQAGDSLFFHYSGHGTQVEDKDGDEVDGFDEAIVCLDEKLITDDEMHELMVVPLPESCRLTSIYDCCHSGTILDLPYLYKCDGNIEVVTDERHKKAAMALFKAGMTYQSGNKASAVNLLKDSFKELTAKTGKKAQKKAEATKTSEADVIMFSGTYLVST